MGSSPGLGREGPTAADYTVGRTGRSTRREPSGGQVTPVRGVRQGRGRLLDPVLGTAIPPAPARATATMALQRFIGATGRIAPIRCKVIRIDPGVNGPCSAGYATGTRLADGPDVGSRAIPDATARVTGDVGVRQDATARRGVGAGVCASTSALPAYPGVCIGAGASSHVKGSPVAPAVAGEGTLTRAPPCGTFAATAVAAGLVITLSIEIVSVACYHGRLYLFPGWAALVLHVGLSPYV